MKVNDKEKLRTLEFASADFNDIDIIKAYRKAGAKVFKRKSKAEDWEEVKDSNWSIGLDYRVVREM